MTTVNCQIDIDNKFGFFDLSIVEEKLKNLHKISLCLSQSTAFESNSKSWCYWELLIKVDWFYYN